MLPLATGWCLFMDKGQGGGLISCKSVTEAHTHVPGVWCGVSIPALESGIGSTGRVFDRAGLPSTGPRSPSPTTASGFDPVLLNDVIQRHVQFIGHDDCSFGVVVAGLISDRG